MYLIYPPWNHSIISNCGLSHPWMFTNSQPPSQNVHPSRIIRLKYQETWTLRLGRLRSGLYSPMLPLRYLPIVTNTPVLYIYIYRRFKIASHFQQFGLVQILWKLIPTSFGIWVNKNILKTAEGVAPSLSLTFLISPTISLKPGDVPYSSPPSLRDLKGNCLFHKFSLSSTKKNNTGKATEETYEPRNLLANLLSS